MQNGSCRDAVFDSVELVLVGEVKVGRVDADEQRRTEQLALRQLRSVLPWEAEPSAPPATRRITPFGVRSETVSLRARHEIAVPQQLGQLHPWLRWGALSPARSAQRRLSKKGLDD